MVHATKLRLAILVILALLLVAACNADFWTLSAQEATGGNGAGLSEYQE